MQKKIILIILSLVLLTSVGCKSLTINNLNVSMSMAYSPALHTTTGAISLEKTK